MSLNVDVKVYYRSREMPEDTALALAAVLAYVVTLPEAAYAWCLDGMNDLETSAATRWAAVLTRVDQIAREAATRGWANPDEADIEVSILPGSRSRTGCRTNWAKLLGSPTG